MRKQSFFFTLMLLVAGVAAACGGGKSGGTVAKRPAFVQACTTGVNKGGGVDKITATMQSDGGVALGVPVSMPLVSATEAVGDAYPRVCWAQSGSNFYIVLNSEDRLNLTWGDSTAQSGSNYQIMITFNGFTPSVAGSPYTVATTGAANTVTFSIGSNNGALGDTTADGLANGPWLGGMTSYFPTGGCAGVTGTVSLTSNPGTNGVQVLGTYDVTLNDGGPGGCITPGSQRRFTGAFTVTY